MTTPMSTSQPTTAGTVIKPAKGADFYLSIKGAAALADFSYGQTKSFEVESKGVIK